AVLLHDLGARRLDVPVEVDAGRLEDAAGRFGQLGSGAVARDQGHAVRHGGGGPYRRLAGCFPSGYAPCSWTTSSLASRASSRSRPRSPSPTARAARFAIAASTSRSSSATTRTSACGAPSPTTTSTR